MSFILSETVNEATLKLNKPTNKFLFRKLFAIEKLDSNCLNEPTSPIYNSLLTSRHNTQHTSYLWEGNDLIEVHWNDFEKYKYQSLTTWQWHNKLKCSFKIALQYRNTTKFFIDVFDVSNLFSNIPTEWKIIISWTSLSSILLKKCI